MDDALIRFMRTTYDLKKYQKLTFRTRLEFYDAVYGVDPEFFIEHVKSRLKKTTADIVIPDVRYINEMEALQELGFIITRVTTPVKHLPVGFFSNTAKEGSLAVAMAYDKNFAVNHNANFSVNWSKKSDTEGIMTAFLERIGYKLDN